MAEIPAWGRILAGAFGRKAEDYVSSGDEVTDPTKEVFQSSVARDLYRHAVLTGQIPGTVKEQGGFLSKLGIGSKPEARPLNERETYAATLGLMQHNKFDLDNKAADIKAQQEQLDLEKKTRDLDPVDYQAKKDKLKAELDYTNKRREHLQFLEDHYKDKRDSEDEIAAKQKKLDIANKLSVLKPQLSASQKEEKSIRDIIEQEKLTPGVVKGQPIGADAIAGLKERLDKAQKKTNAIILGLNLLSSGEDINLFDLQKAIEGGYVGPGGGNLQGPPSPPDTAPEQAPQGEPPPSEETTAALRGQYRPSAYERALSPYMSGVMKDLYDFFNQSTGRDPAEYEQDNQTPLYNPTEGQW